MQNAPTGLFTLYKRSDIITPVYSMLHWLFSSSGIDFNNMHSIITGRDLLSLIARQLGKNAMMHTAVAPSNPMLMEKALVGTLGPEDSQ